MQQVAICCKSRCWVSLGTAVHTIPPAINGKVRDRTWRRLRGMLVGGESVFSSCLQQTRSLQTPLGGFPEDLPPSFGRSQAKGEISSVNLRRQRQLRKRVRGQRKRLALPNTRAAESGETAASLEQVKQELFALIKKSKVYAGKGHDTREKAQVSTVASSAAPGVKPTDAVFFNEHAVASNVVATVQASEGDETDADAASAVAVSHTGSPSGLPRTLLDDMVSEVDPLPANTPTAEASTKDLARLSTAQSAVFPLHVSSSSSSHGGHSAEQDAEAWKAEQQLERRYGVVPTSTVFGSDLDRLERDMMREFHQHGKELPVLDDVFRRFGDGRRGKRMMWEPSSSFDQLRPADMESNARDEFIVGVAGNRNLAAYHMEAEAYRERVENAVARGGTAFVNTAGIHLTMEDEEKALEGRQTNTESADSKAFSRGQNTSENTPSGDLPAEDNPHFDVDSGAAPLGTAPLGDFDVSAVDDMPNNRVVVVDARTDYSARLTTAHARPGEEPVFDAYNQRPADKRVVELRGMDYWAKHEHRQRVESHEAHRADAFAMEMLQEGAVDSSEVEYSTNLIRKESFLYFQAHPINEMIQEAFVRIRELVPKDGSDSVRFHAEEGVQVPGGERGKGEGAVVQWMRMDVDIPVQEARRMAQELGLDLIRVGSIHSTKSDRRVVAECRIGDHREHMRDMIRFKVQRVGVQPPKVKECIEVPFRGGTHPHGIRFKAVGIAKHLLHRHTIRINLTKFGTPREGFPVFQSILDEIKRQCLQLKAYHKAGEIQANYNEIYCFLYPSTGRSPKTTVEHPTPEEVAAARDFFILANEKAIFFDDLQDTKTAKERLQYLTKLENGTAWADKDAGLSLQRQRAMKVMLGYLPKGNKELYAARGDVNIPAPFRTSHITSTERWLHPPESNLEQASRGAATLGKRAGMSISEMHDRGETPENPTQLDRFYYKAEGPALEVGEIKEALGLKGNRKKPPPLGPGFATLGMANGGRSDPPPAYTTR